MRTAGVAPYTQPATATGTQRLWPWRACAVLAALFLFVANLEVWAYPSVADTAEFVETAQRALEREDVREALATRTVEALFSETPILMAAIGDTVIAMVTGLLGSETFQAIFAGIARQLQLAIVRGEPVAIAIESRELQVVVLAVASILAPEESESLTLEGEALRIELFSANALPSYESKITILRWAGISAGVVGLFLLTLPFAVRRDRWSIRLAGLALVAVALATLAVVIAAGWLLQLQLDDRHVETVVGGIAAGFLSRLVTQAFVILLLGLALCAYGFSLWRAWERPAGEPS